MTRLAVEGALLRPLTLARASEEQAGACRRARDGLQSPQLKPLIRPIVSDLRELFLRSPSGEREIALGNYIGKRALQGRLLLPPRGGGGAEGLRVCVRGGPHICVLVGVDARAGVRPPTHARRPSPLAACPAPGALAEDIARMLLEAEQVSPFMRRCLARQP